MECPHRIWTVLMLAIFTSAPVVRGAGERTWAEVSPFTRVQSAGGVANVEYDGTTYELVSIDDVPADRILAFCRERYGVRAEKRFSEDLAEVLADMGHKPGDTVKLVLSDMDTGAERTVERAPMTRENRRAVMRARDDAQRAVQDDAAVMRAALDAFRHVAETRWSYLRPSGIDLAKQLQPLEERIGPEMSRERFALELQKIVALGIDGHAGVLGWERNLARGYTPFLVEPVGDRFVAFKPDRGGLLDPARPYLEAIDGKPLAEWLSVAGAYVPNASPAYSRREALRLLRCVQFLRKELDLPQREQVEITLANAEGDDRATVQVDVVDRMPTYGTWPRANGRPALANDLAYVRLARMTADPDLGRRGAALLADDKTAGVIVDVRDNSGGRRDALRQVLPLLLKPGDPPRVVNAAVQRRHPSHTPEDMASRFLHPEDWDGWTDAERGAIAAFRTQFKPQWDPPANLYGAWHYMVVSPAPLGAEPPPHKPVAILMNGKCFSATDVFLAALKGVPGVTLVGTPSSGGSANATAVRLGDTPFRVRVGTMVSFQPDGQLLDGNGVQPDVLVEPLPEFFLTGGRDVQLERAAELIRAGGSR